MNENQRKNSTFFNISEYMNENAKLPTMFIASTQSHRFNLGALTIRMNVQQNTRWENQFAI